MSTLWVLGALTLTATAAFLIRLAYPIGVVCLPLNLQLGHVPQYVLWYTAGTWAHRWGKELHNIVSLPNISRVGACASLITAIGVTQMLNKVGDGVDAGTNASLAKGGCNRFALLYAFSNEFVGHPMSAVLLKMSNRYHILKRGWSVFGLDTERYSYAAFLVHVLVLVAVQSSLDKTW